MVSEPRDIYEQRTQQVASYLSSVSAATPSPTFQPQEQPWWKKGLSTALDFMGRPLAATSSAIGAGLQGQDVGLSFMQGLTGQSPIHNIEDVLKQQGMAGGWQRKTLGFLGSAVADPETWATLPFGGGGSLLMRGVRALTPGLATGIEATPIVRGLLGAGQAATATQPVESVINRAYQEAQKPLSSLESAFNKPTEMPVLGGIYKAVASISGPRIAAGNDQMRQILNGANQIGQEMPTIAQAIKSQVRMVAQQGGQDVLGPLDDMGRMTLSKGRQVPAVMALSEPQYRDFLTPQQLALADTGHKLWSPVFEYATEIGVPMKEYKIQPDEWYWPRVTKTEPTGGGYQPKVVGTEKGGQKARTVVSAEQAQHAVVAYEHPVVGFEQRLDEMLTAIANRQLEKRLEPLAVRQNLELMAATKAAAKEAGQRVGQAENLRLMVKRVRRGDVPSSAQINAVGETFPELRAQLEEAMSISPTGFEQAMGEMGTELQQRLGTTSKEFMQAVKTARDARVGGGEFNAAEAAQPWRAGSQAYPMQNVSRVDITEALRTLGNSDKATAQMLGDFYSGVFRMDKEERAKALQAVVDSVKTEKGTLQEAAQTAGQTARDVKAQEAAAIAGRQEVQGVAYLKNLWFTPEEARALETTLVPASMAGGTRQKVAGALGLAGTVSGLMRTLMSSVDLSAGMIQGLLMLARDPIGWLTEFARGAAALFDPLANDRFLASEVVQRFHQRVPNAHLASGGGGEFMGSSGAIGAFLGKIPVVGGLLQKAEASTIGAGARAFDVTGNGIRVRAGNMLADMAERYGRNPMEAGDFVNRMTGVSVVAGLPQNWQAFESSMLLFANRYTRASMAMGLDALTRGGMAGAEARATFANMMVGGLAWYSNVARLAGQEPNLDPSKSSFLSLKVGNDNVGIGSVWVSMAKLLARIAENPYSAVPTSWDNLTKDNPITQWWRSRGSPIGSVLYDKLIAGQDFVGAPLDTPVELARYLGSRFLPFTLDAYLMQQGQQADIKSLPGQLAGMRVFPAPRSEWRETVAQERFNTPYTDLNPVQQAQVEQDPRVKNIPAAAGQRGERQVALGKVYDTYNTNISKLADMVGSGDVTKDQFRMAVAKLNNDRSIRMEAVPPLSGRGNYQPTPQEQARRQYYEIMNQPDPRGKPNFDGADAFLATLPSNYVDYIQQKELAGIERLPQNAQELMRGLYDARQALKPYWDLQSTILAKYGIDMNKLSPAQQTAVQATPQYKAAQREIGQREMQMRFQNKAINQALVDWYGRAPLTLASARRA